MGYTIWPDGPTGEVLQAVNAERNRQEDLRRSGKFHWTCASPDAPMPEKLAVLAEEFGEVSKEVVEQIMELGKYNKEGLPYPSHRSQFRASELRKELIQVAAVAVAWAESLEK